MSRHHWPGAADLSDGILAQQEKGSAMPKLVGLIKPADEQEGAYSRQEGGSVHRVAPQVERPIAMLSSAEARAAALYVRCGVVLRVRRRLCAGIPADPARRDAFLRGGGVEGAADRRELLAKMGRDLDERAAEQVEEDASVFYRQGGEGGPLCLKEHNVKAMLKESAVALGYMGAGGIRQAMQHAVFVKPEHILLQREGRPLTAPDGVAQHISHRLGPRGPMSAINRFEYVERAELTFEVWVLRSHPRKPSREQLETMLLAAQESGLGARRTMSEGKFDLQEFWMIAE
ncbi:MAG: hypothetical protein M1118_07965 [Chloroflexi bacterium]|nr:hypothetical protein [Chloroflexota bacterium]